jgi:hypothetical protein
VTAVAERQLNALRGKRAEAARVAIDELRSRGCERAGYRLTGAVLKHVCCRHLYGDDRLLTTWPAVDHAVIVLVGPHKGRAGGVYGALMAALGLEDTEEERSKPPCYEPDGIPPVDPRAADGIIDAVNGLAKRTRRRR